MKKNLKFSGATLTASLLFFLIITVFACKKSDTTETPGPNQVFMQNISFNPSTITVAHGTTITWMNKDNVTHTVTANDASFNSGNIAPGGSFTHTFTTAGTVNYHCSIHSGMNGVVVAQ